MTIDELTTRSGEWLSGGPLSEIVISSRVRLARNIAGYPFLSKATDAQRREIEHTLGEKIAAMDLGHETFYVDMNRSSELDRLVLVERHLISRQHADAEGSRGVILSTSEQFALMINEEDHLRLQVLRGGFQLEETWREIDRIDSLLEDKMDFAFYDRLGYLTACPTNVGTGIRVSVMLHLPALKLTNELEKVMRAARDMHLAVRGLYGEGTEATGDFYQVSNQTTLGKSEEEIIREFKDDVIPKIVEYETLARETLVRERPMALDDKIWRAYGVLENARAVSSEETLFLLSHLRMGVSLGRIDRLKLDTVNRLFLLTQPGHLQKLNHSPLDGEQRSIARAEFIRKTLASEN
jgi:protein arginine kinase